MEKTVTTGKTVICSNENCGKKVPSKDARSYLDISKGKGMLYFCSSDCALEKLFGLKPLKMKTRQSK